MLQYEMITSYRELVYSNLLDKVVYDLWITEDPGNLVFMFALYQVANGSIFPMISLYARNKITHFYTRMLFVWVTLVYTFLFGQYYWMTLFLSIESLRLFMMFGLLPIFKHISRNIPVDPVAETAFLRCFKLAKQLRQLSPSNVVDRVTRIYIGYNQGDSSESWTSQERECVERFFRDFERTYWVFDEGHYTIFFPTFAIHVNASGFHLTSEGAIQLNTHCDNTICTICHDEISEYSARLRCGHEYCLKCIYEWLDYAYTCPMCRREVS